MKYIARYENGHSNLEEVCFIIADNKKQVIDFMQDGLIDYVDSHRDCESYYDYYDYDFVIWEATEGDIIRWNIKENEWLDITQ